jgi:hypothetical protein
LLPKTPKPLLHLIKRVVEIRKSRFILKRHTNYILMNNNQQLIGHPDEEEKVGLLSGR